MKACDLGKT